jgi:diaminopimelate decarboxylase
MKPNEETMFAKQMTEKALKQYETPFFLYSTEVIRKHIADLYAAFHDELDVFYSFKANPNMSVCAFMRTEGVHAEICSRSELYLAQAAGFDPQNIIFVGPAKDEKTLRHLIDTDIYAIVVENVLELEYISRISKAVGKRTRIALRLNPHFSNPKAPLKMGGVPSQFGMDAQELVKARDYLGDPYLKIIGLHVYNGTRILDAASIAMNCEAIFSLAEQVTRELHIPLEMLDIGGGFGVPYFEGEPALDIDSLRSAMAKPLRQFRKQFPHARLITESGRYLVANSGLLLSEVLYVKRAFGKNFAITNAGINCHMAATGIGSFLRRNFPVSCFNKSDGGGELYTVTGPLCTPSDIIAQDVMLPKLVPGDFIQVGMSGAYGPSASPSYFLSHGFPKELLLHDGVIHLVRERDEFADIFRKHTNIFQANQLKGTRSESLTSSRHG